MSDSDKSLDKSPNKSLDLSLQQLSFQNSINSIVFEENFQKMSKKEKLKFIKKLISLSDYVTVSKRPENWYETHIVAYDYLYSGNLRRDIYNRWAAIWKVISTQTYALVEEATVIPESYYHLRIKIWAKSPDNLLGKPHKRIPENAKIFIPKDPTGKYEGIKDGRFKTAEHYFADKMNHMRLDSIIVPTYQSFTGSSLLSLICSDQESTVWEIQNSMAAILRNNENTKILQDNGYDISSIPYLDSNL